MKFKAGDKVRCIDAGSSYFNSLKRNRAYVVASPKAGQASNLVCLVVSNHSPRAHEAPHYANRFRKVEPNGKKQ